MKYLKSNFTLIEMLIVVIILSILIGISIPNIKKSIDNFNLESFVNDIYYLCLYLKESAISKGEQFSLYINKDTEPLEFQPLYKEEDKLVNFRKPYKLPSGITFLIEPKDKTDINFYPDGSCDPIVITFQNNSKKKLSLVIKGSNCKIQVK
mgnify:CR=1 FL=1